MVGFGVGLGMSSPVGSPFPYGLPSGPPVKTGLAIACCGSIEVPETRTASNPRMKPIRMMRVRTVTIASAPAFPARVRIAWGGEAPAPRDRSIMDAPERSTLPGRALLGRNERLGTLAGGIPRTARSRPSLVEFELEPCAPFLWAGEPATRKKLAHPCAKINSKRVLAHIFAPTLRSGRAASSPRDIITENYSQPIIARAPETVGNERTPSHPYGISLLAPPVSRTDRRRPEPAHRARAGRPRQEPPGRDHVRGRGAIV